ncbi:unannotated protein [freshwater metagenome]|uniref:Unannotated protein n=1 Tax=freshwater metagenome TaxID=449393 RepID=A0A6J7DHD1_9ZZZZ|nr:alpha/beta hydrolase [Actinomycetota bacterium]
MSELPHLAIWERITENPQATVICVHGGLDRGGSFARMARRMDHFRVIVYDRRGYQQSRERQPLSLDGHAEDLRVVVDAVRNDQPTLVFGHSYGGVVALRSVQTGAKVDALVTYEPPLPWAVPRTGSFGELNPDPAAEAESFFRRMVSNSAWERMNEVDQQSRRNDGPALHDDLLTIRNPIPAIDWASVTTPWTYGYGDTADRLEYYESVAARLRLDVKLIKTSMVAHAGHGAHLSNPEAMVRLIDDRLEKL